MHNLNWPGNFLLVHRGVAEDTTVSVEISVHKLSWRIFVDERSHWFPLPLSPYKVPRSAPSFYSDRKILIAQHVYLRHHRSFVHQERSSSTQRRQERDSSRTASKTSTRSSNHWAVRRILHLSKFEIQRSPKADEHSASRLSSGLFCHRR